MPSTLMVRPVRAGSEARTRTVIPTGITMPPPRPWRTRKAISEGASQAAPASAEPSTNSVSAVR